MTRTLDELTSIDPLELSEQDLDEIVAYQRKHRVNVEGGAKVKKEIGPKQKISLADLGLASTKVSSGGGVTRR